MIGRRTFLATGIGALAASLASGQDKAAPRRVKSMLWLWMDGGMSQLDTWDPKPGHANGAGLRAIDTTVPGVSLSELMPRCAGQMHRLSLVRTVQLPRVLSGRAADTVSSAMHCSSPSDCDEVDPAAGTLLASVLARPNASVPAFVSIDSPSIPEVQYFGAEYLPFHISPDLEREWSQAGGESPGPKAEVLLAAQDQTWEKDRRFPGSDRFGKARMLAQALRSEPFRAALRTEGEPERLRKEYGSGFGRRCLQARRLVEAGATVVEIAQHGWERGAETFDAIRSLSSELDAGLGTLVRDLAERDLLRDTVILCIGPGGRSAVLNAKGGRDPGVSTFSVALAGGSLKGGRVFGETGADGTLATPPVNYADLQATLYRACGVDPNLKYQSPGHTRKFVSGGTWFTWGKPLSPLFD